MSASLTLEGIVAFLRTLERLPEQVQQASEKVITAAAADVESRLEQAIPVGPSGTRNGQAYAGGNLRASVRTRKLSELSVRVQYGSSGWDGVAPHAHLFEQGTGRRQNRRGANRGAMKAAKVLAKLASQRRREMNEELRATLARELEKL